MCSLSLSEPEILSGASDLSIHYPLREQINEYTCFSSGSGKCLAEPRPMSGGACTSDVFLCGNSVCLVQVLSLVPWRASGMSCIMDTFLSKTRFIFYTLTHLCLSAVDHWGISPGLCPLPCVASLFSLWCRGLCSVLPLSALTGWPGPRHCLCKGIGDTVCAHLKWSCCRQESKFNKYGTQ